MAGRTAARMKGPLARLWAQLEHVLAPSINGCPSVVLPTRTRTCSNLALMTDLGFWNVAQADPSHLALVDPDGTEHAAGDLLAAVNQVVHGLRALRLQPGDV